MSNICNRCKKIFTSEKRLTTHLNKYPNCTNKCSICRKTFSSPQMLKTHKIKITCHPKYECAKCNVIFDTRYKLNFHDCKILNPNSNYADGLINRIENSNMQINVEDILNSENMKKIIENPTSEKQVIIVTNNYINNLNNNSNNNSNNNTNNNNTNNANTNIKKTKKYIKNNFFETCPRNFEYGYLSKEEDIKKFSQLHDYKEEDADAYMYDEDNFKEDKPKDLIYKYDKETLQVEGMKLLFSKLQEDPMNRNVMIRKTKSGKCFIYDKVWIEEKLQKIITRICNKLCDYLYDKNTSLNHFIRLVIGSQPSRYMELRKHIEQEIINNNNKYNEEQLMISN